MSRCIDEVIFIITVVISIKMLFVMFACVLIAVFTDGCERKRAGLSRI